MFSWLSIILQLKVNGAQQSVPSNIIIVLTDDQDVVLNGMVRNFNGKKMDSSDAFIHLSIHFTDTDATDTKAAGYQRGIIH